MKNKWIVVAGLTIATASWAQSARFSRDTSVTDQPVVKDSVTALFWQGCPAGLTGNACAAGTAGTYNWANALSYCSGLNWGGHQDWRLPNVKELRSIVNERTSNRAIDVTAFPNTPADYFWSSSSYAGNPSSAWYVHFNNGAVNVNGKSLNSYVRCVRSGP